MEAGEEKEREDKCEENNGSGIRGGMREIVDGFRIEDLSEIKELLKL